MFGEQGLLSANIENAIDEVEKAKNTADAQVNSKAIADAQERANVTKEVLEDLFEQVDPEIVRLKKLQQEIADEIKTLEDQKKRHERVKEHNNDPAVMLDKAKAEVERFNDLSIKDPDDEYYAAQAQIEIDKAIELHRALKSRFCY